MHKLMFAIKKNALRQAVWDISLKYMVKALWIPGGGFCVFFPARAGQQVRQQGPGSFIKLQDHLLVFHSGHADQSAGAESREKQWTTKLNNKKSKD